MIPVKIDRILYKRLAQYVRYICAPTNPQYCVPYNVAISKWNYIIDNIISILGDDANGGSLCLYPNFSNHGKFRIIRIRDLKTKTTVWDISFEDIHDDEGNITERLVHGLELDRCLASNDHTLNENHLRAFISSYIKEEFRKMFSQTFNENKQENGKANSLFHKKRRLPSQTNVISEKLYRPSVEPMIDRIIGEYNVLDGSWQEQILGDLPQKGWIQDICMYSAVNTGGKTYALYRRCDNGKYFFTEKVSRPDDEYIHTITVSYKSVPSIIWNDAKALIRDN